MHAAPTFPIFIVEDSDDDLFLFQRLLAKAAIANPVEIATDGQQAVDLLAECIASRDAAKLPRIIFLDLKLPLRSGFEVLEWIRNQPELARSVVIILSSSAEARDVTRAYERGAQGYLVKYPAPAVFQETVNRIAGLASDADLDRVTLPGLPRP